MTEYIDMALIDKDLMLDDSVSFSKLDWLEQSYTDVDSFWLKFKNSVDHIFCVGGTSRIFDSYNFFYDIVHRNRDNTAALCWYDPSAGLKEMSYQELGVRATQKAAAWSRLGAQPGQTFCIIKAMSIELAVDLLAALKNGYVISLLPPKGKAFLLTRLAALQPDYIVTEEKNVELLSDWSEKLLPDVQGVQYTSTDANRFFTYPSKATVFRCFDPCTSDLLQTTDISSNAAFLLALRDGFITLGLRPGEVYAAPDMSLLETQPSLLLAGLLCGATYFHLLPEQIAANPELVTRQPIKIFGVSKKVRDILLDSQTKVGSVWERWFRNPLESNDFEQWHCFVDAAGLENAYSYNCKWEVALGGCALMSVGRKGRVHMSMLPAPGVAWTLAEQADTESESITGYGVFCASLPGDSVQEKVATHTLMVMDKGQLFSVGSSVVNRRGRFFTIDEVLACITKIAENNSVFFSISEVPSMDTAQDSSFVLLVFTGVNVAIDRDALQVKINFTISEQMGDEFQPDRVEFFPLFPRFLAEMEIDHNWCREQYMSGRLIHKSKDKIFKLLTLLRACATNGGTALKM